MTFKIQYVSDIHLEMRDWTNISTIIPVRDTVNLALCGDIGFPGDRRYTEFIDMCSKYFKNVFVIYGNHEFYNTDFTMDTMGMRKHHAKNFPSNVYFMDNRSLFVNKKTNDVYQELPIGQNPQNYVKIIGSTLWTNIDMETSLRMNDYRYIYFDENRRITWKIVSDMFRKNVMYICEELDKSKNVECILLTHHSPHPISNNSNKGTKMNTAYSTYIPDFYMRRNLIACIHGHTHHSINETIEFGNNKIKILSNQVGYPMESLEKVGYDYMAYFELK